MPVVDVINVKKETVGQVELPDQIFDVPVKQHLLHEVVVAQMASRRSGTAATKDRSQISGSTRKLFRQKGTGRARAGNIKSPLRRGGGTIFGPKPRSFAYKPPKRVRRGAMKVALTAKLQENELLVVDTMAMDEIKTKKFAQTLAGLGLDNALVVTEGPDENLELSARNIPGVKVLRAAGLNVYDVLKYKHLVLLQSSLPKIEERLLK